MRRFHEVVLCDQESHVNAKNIVTSDPEDVIDVFILLN
jgi:hypothetical protein